MRCRRGIFADLDEAGRADAVAELGLPTFRGKQLANQYYGRLIADPHQMTDLPAAVREQVADALFPRLLDAVAEIECDAGETRKMLWRAVDGTTFESVLMRYPQRNTVCISSQAGCGMACPFCATGQGGLKRNLSTAEILEQVRAAAVELRDRDHGRLSNIVFMGMGEPLANYNRVLAAVRRIIAPPPNGFGISARSVTVSTVGLAPCDPQAGRRTARRHARAVTARSRRRAARHPGAGQQPLEGVRSPRCRTVLRRRDRAGGCRSSTR